MPYIDPETGQLQDGTDPRSMFPPVSRQPPLAGGGPGDPFALGAPVPPAAAPMRADAPYGLPPIGTPVPRAPPEPPPAAAPPPVPPTAIAPASTPMQTKTEVERTVLSPQSRAAMAAAAGSDRDQAGAAERATAATKAKNASDVGDQRAADETEASRARQDAIAADMNDTRQQLAQARFDEANAHAEQKVAAAQKKVDDDFASSQKGYYEDKGTGFKIVDAILKGASIRNSYILGEDPNNNPVMRTIREKIDADKTKKLAQYAKSKEYLAEAKKGPEAARQALLDARSDIDVGYARQLQITAKKAEALKANRKLDPQRLQVTLDATNALADEDLAKAKAEIVQRQVSRAAITNSHVKSETAPAPRAPGGPNNDTLVYGVGGKPIGQTKTPDEAKQANAANRSYRQLDGLLGALQQSYATNGKAYNPFTQTYQDQKALRAAAVVAFKEQAKLGVLNGPDMGLVEGAIGGAWTGHQGVEKLQAARDASARGHAAALDSLSLPGEQLTKQLRSAEGGESPQGPYASVSTARLRQALVAAGKAGDKEAVSEARSALAARGER